MKPLLPEYVHVNLSKFEGWNYHDEQNDYSYATKKIPFIWLKFNGLGLVQEWSWNKRYEKAIKAELGDFYDSDIHVVEWNITQNIAYLMKSARSMGFDPMQYYTQFADKDIKYFNSTDISI